MKKVYNGRISHDFIFLPRFTNNILSTAQQVWLQKLGGAKIPDRQYSDATIKADKPEIPIPRIEAGFEKTKSLQGEKAASGEPQRGERLTHYIL